MGLEYLKEILDNPKINLWQDWLLQYEMEPYLLIQTCKSGYKVGEFLLLSATMTT